MAKSMTFYGIYKITNLLNGKMYIGQHKTENLDDGYMGSGKWLKNAIKKYGVENFRKEWLMFCENEEELNYMERVYVDQTWVDRSDTYNLKLGGESGGSMKGFHHTEETKQKIRLKVSNPSDETRQKMRISHLGQIPANKGKKMSLEQRKKLSIAHKGITAGMKGKHHSEETKRKISIASIGRKPWNKGKEMSKESKEKLRVANIGKHHSEESKKKIGEKHKGSKFYTNGIMNIRVKDGNPIPEGFVRGRIRNG